MKDIRSRIARRDRREPHPRLPLRGPLLRRVRSTGSLPSRRTSRSRPGRTRRIPPASSTSGWWRCSPISRSPPACARPRAPIDARLATVRMHLQFTGAPLRGDLAAEGEFQGFAEHAARQGLARFTIAAEGRVACYGTGAFMPLPPPPGRTMHPVVPGNSRRPRRWTRSSLDTAEREVLARADEAIARGRQQASPSCRASSATSPGAKARARWQRGVTACTWGIA